MGDQKNMAKNNELVTVAETKEAAMSTVTHKGKWYLNKEQDIYIDCYVTNDGKRLLSLRGNAGRGTVNMVCAGR